MPSLYIRLVTILLALLLPFGTALAADMGQKSGTASGTDWTLSVSAGTKYLMPQNYKGADTITDTSGFFVANTDTEYSDRGFFGLALGLTGERKTSLSLPGFKDIRLVGAFSYAGGTDRRTRTQSAGAGTGNYFVAMSIDPAANWLGGIGAPGDTASTRVSVGMDNFELSLGLEGRGDAFAAGGASVTPILGAGILASTQRYKVSSRITSLTNADFDTLVETLRTNDIGPELRAGLATAFANGMSLTAMANAALLVGWADLEASQSLTTSVGWNPSGRMAVPYATRSRSDTFVSGLFGLSVKAEAPVAEGMKLGLELSGRYWTDRPTVKNPTQLGATVLTVPPINPGVRIGHDSAAEAGAALTFSYCF